MLQTDRVGVSPICPHLSDHFFHDWTGAAGERSAQLQWQEPGKPLFGCRWVGEQSDAASPITLVPGRASQRKSLFGDLPRLFFCVAGLRAFPFLLINSVDHAGALVILNV